MIDFDIFFPVIPLRYFNFIILNVLQFQYKMKHVGIAPNFLSLYYICTKWVTRKKWNFLAGLFEQVLLTCKVSVITPH